MIEKIRRSLSFLNHDLVSEIIENSTLQEFEENTTMIKEGEYIKVIPYVSTGLIKVFTSHEEKELLLYYLEPNNSCIMSFSAGMANEPSKVYAITEEKTTALQTPAPFFYLRRSSPKQQFCIFVHAANYDHPLS